MIRICLADYPDRFVGKKNPLYAFTNDGQCQRKPAYFASREYADAHYFCAERYAKVWTDDSALKRLLSAASGRDTRWNETTWTAYEVVHADGTSTPLDKYLEKP